MISNDKLIHKLQRERILYKILSKLQLLLTYSSIASFLCILFILNRKEAVFVFLNYFAIFNALSGLLLHKYFNLSIIFYKIKFPYTEEIYNQVSLEPILFKQLLVDLRVFAENASLKILVDKLNKEELNSFIKEQEAIHWRKIGNYFLFLYITITITIFTLVIYNLLFPGNLDSDWPN